MTSDSTDNVYYNITIQYEDNPKGVARFAENRTEPILKNSQNYYCCVVRFYVPLSQVPLMIAPIQNNQANPNLMIYSVTLGYNGTFVQTYLTFTPSDMTVPVPPAPSANPPNYVQVITSYYNITSIQILVDMFNTALATSFAGITPPIGSVAPYIIFDSVTNLFSIVCQSAYYDKGLALPISIYFNNAAQPLFDGLEVYKTATNDPNGKDYQVVVRNTNNNYIAPNYYLIQNFNSLSNWNSLLSIVFLSGTIPVRYEQIPAVNRNGEANFRPIITDFQPLFTNTGIERNAAQFFVQGVYRLIDLVGSDVELRKFDLDIYWQDKNGNLYPLYIAPNEILNIKLLFVKKSLFKNLMVK